MSEALLVDHPSEIQDWRWPNFTPAEIACPCCGEVYLDADSMDALQEARAAAGRLFILNSAHRCAIHNARVGGAPLSQHKWIAFDISLAGHDRIRLFEILREAGFGSFGFYRTFIHADMRPGRRWYGKGVNKLWIS